MQKLGNFATAKIDFFGNERSDTVAGTVFKIY